MVTAGVWKQVEQKELEWYFKITEYAEELLDFSSIDWPERGS